MKNSILTLLAIGVFCFLLPYSALARPEYSAKTQSPCSNCHVTPWGGGPRNLYGKIFGSRGLGNPITNGSDTYYADFRSLFFFPMDPTATGVKSGTVLMEAAPTANVPVTANEDGSEMRLVGTYNLSNFGPGSSPREAYIYWKFADNNPIVSHVLAGRFTTPFGLLSDEHRTYTHMLTNSTLNDYDTGLSVSGDPARSLHYDLALVNNLKGGADNFNNSQDFMWANVFNLRWTPSFFPGIFGASQNFQYSVNQPQPYAFSFYTVVSLDRLTSQTVNGSLSGEFVSAKNFVNPINNSQIGRFFIPQSDAAYQTAASAGRSLGFYLQAKLDLSPRWNVFYKYDYVQFEDTFYGDGFGRSGFGFEFFMNSNVSINARYETVTVGRPEIAPNSVLAAEDDVIVMLRMWI